MGDCKCKEKTAEGSQQPCADANEESFRQAFLRESKKTAQLSSEVQFHVKDKERIKVSYYKHLERVETQGQSLLNWCQEASKQHPMELSALARVMGRECPLPLVVAESPAPAKTPDEVLPPRRR